MREVHSSPPQPEDPDRALDPGLEEDPDIFVELVDRTFYQLSCDGALVAIIADYPGLLPASHVSKTEVPTSEKDPFFALHPPHTYFVLQGRPSGRHAEPAVSNNKGHQSQVGLKGRQSGLRRRRRGTKENPALWWSSFLKYHNAHISW